MLDDELISLVWYFGLSRGPFTAVCSLFTAVCSSIFVVFKSFQLWQLNGLMHHISIHCMVSSVMEFVPLPISSSSLCGFVAGSVMLKIRDTSNTEVLIKGFVAMLKIVDCAIVDASILGIISLIVVSNFQGVVLLYSSMVVEIRGLLDVISCLSVLYAPILLCCICVFVLAVCLAYLALFSCFMNTWRIRIYKISVWPKNKKKLHLIFSSINDTLYTTKISFISWENTFLFLGKILPELEFQIVKPFRPGTKLNLVNIYVL